MKLKIITSDESLLRWKSKDRKIKNIKKALLTMKNVCNVDVEVIFKSDLNPPVVGGRIPHYYTEQITKEFTKDGEAFIVQHYSLAKKVSLGLEPCLRGLAYDDANFYSEAYFWADEHTKRGRFNQFEETCLHEVRHLIFNRLKDNDDTHELHSKYGTIKNSFSSIDYRNYQTNLIDSISSWLKNKVSPKDLQPLVKRKSQLVIDEMKRLGYDVQVFEGYRSIERQDELYEQGRVRPGTIVTNAKGGESLHNYGVAVDIVFGVPGKPSWNPKEPWNVLGNVGKMFGFEWGGDWKGFTDLPHFQLTLGYSLDDFINKKIDYNKFK